VALLTVAQHQREDAIGVALIEPEHELVQVAVQVLDAELVERADDPALEQGPEVLDRSLER